MEQQIQLQKHRSLFALGLVLLFLILFSIYMFLAVPTTDSIQERDNQITTLERQNEILQKKLDEKKNEPGMAEDKVEEQLPLWDNTGQLLMDLDEVSKQAHVEPVSLNFTIEQANSGASREGSSSQSTDSGKQNAADKVGKVHTAAVIKGSYEDILAYVTGLQNLKRIVKVDTLDISKSVQQTLTVSLTFTAYFDPSYQDKVSK